MGTCKRQACRKPRTVKIGAIFGASHVTMHLWLQAIVLIASSKKGISTNQLHRCLAEFDFRQTNCIASGVDDQARAVALLTGVAGHRLTYSAAGGVNV